MNLSGYGTSSDDETDVNADGEVGLAREINGDKGAFGALSGSVTHDPEEVDAGAGEAGGGGGACAEVLACGGEGEGGHGGDEERWVYALEIWGGKWT